MWILESRGDCFQGRRMWLKPGKQYLFGRVKKDGVRFALDNKTVSRKHFVISVDDVDEHDVGNAYARTRITIEDQGSKTGTVVNGERAKQPRSLLQAENVIRVGTCQEELIVKWEAKVLTFNLLKKELKSGVLKLKQERVKDLDIRVISDYIPGTSSLVVVNKRNTAKGLQALIDSRALVAESYIDALEYAATPTDLNEEENPCALELDYDKAWPDPSEHLPPQGKEPTSRPSTDYQPNPARSHIFDHFTFVFGDQMQYDNLLPPITTGHGKALLYSYDEEETTSDDLVLYMRQVAGQKSFGDAHRDTDQGAVIMVRWTGKRDADRTTKIINEVSLKLDQRAIEQGEFLDAILANDASLLRQTVPFESSADSNPVPVASNLPLHDAIETSGGQASKAIYTAPAVVGPEQNWLPAAQGDEHQPVGANLTKGSNEEVTQSSPKKAFRFSPVRKAQIKDFDDDFDENAVIPYDEDDEDGSSREVLEDESWHPERRTSEASSAMPSDKEVNGRHIKSEISRSRKRSRSVAEDDVSLSGGADLDDLLPAAADMKRRRIASKASQTRQSESVHSIRGGVIIPKTKPKVFKDVDVKEELRVKRERDKEMAKEAGKGEDQRPIEFDENGQLPVFDIVTEYIDLPTREKPLGAGCAPQSDRWDPQWNGRKNFKAFRRARDNVNGESLARRRAHTRVIVPLVDAKQVTYGIGDRYWEKTEEDKQRDRERKKRASQRSTQSQTQGSNENNPSRLQDNHSAEDQEVASDPDVREISPKIARLQQEAAEIVDGDVDPDEPRRTRAADNQARTAEDTRIQTQTQHTSSPTAVTRGPKRAASSARGSSLKKQKTLPIQTVHGSGSESDDSDDMKFKFGRGRRGRGRGRGRS